MRPKPRVVSCVRSPFSASVRVAPYRFIGMNLTSLQSRLPATNRVVREASMTPQTLIKLCPPDPSSYSQRPLSQANHEHQSVSFWNYPASHRLPPYCGSSAARKQFFTSILVKVLIHDFLTLTFHEGSSGFRVTPLQPAWAIKTVDQLRPTASTEQAFSWNF